METREMLELAAKAVGNKAEWYSGLGMAMAGDGPIPTLWNPLGDRADAFSLMTALGMEVAVAYNTREVPHLCRVKARRCIADCFAATEEGPAAQRDELTMLAITRCAAEVGRRMTK